MAYGISSVELVCNMAKAGFLSAFGTAGLPPNQIKQAIQTIQQELTNEPYSFNFIHAPSELAWERKVVELFLQYKIRTIEASAFINLTPNIVWYRAAGLEEGTDGAIIIHNHIIAKLSRGEVARKFLSPAPAKMLQELVSDGRITVRQAQMAEQVPMADDITAEADSGGHTDGQALISLLPSMMELRDELQSHYKYKQEIRVGAAGGLGTPQSILGAFMMGADYVVTGSINQSSIEAGTSDAVKSQLAQASMADVMMCPSSDMFELGAKVQVLKRGTMYPLKAQRLYEAFRKYDSIESIPVDERVKLEKQIFQKTLDEVWQETVAYKQQSNPQHIEKAARNPRFKMSLVFHWYLGQSSAWAVRQNETRSMDYQIWCGSAMGAFNEWVRGTYLEKPENRHVAHIAHHLLYGAAYLYRMRTLQNMGMVVPKKYLSYKPEQATVLESNPQSLAGV
jgi:PfaD family protein